jgi:hypothetical protein
MMGPCHYRRADEILAQIEAANALSTQAETTLAIRAQAHATLALAAATAIDPDLCVPGISSTALTSRVALPAVRP